MFSKARLTRFPLFLGTALEYNVEGVNSIWIKYVPAFISKNLEGRQLLQKVIANTGWLFVDKFLRMGVGLVVGVWIARYLGPEQFGLFSFATAFVALFSIIATLGLDGVVVRDLVHHPEQRDEILGTTFLLRMAASGLALLASVAAIMLIRPTESVTHWLVGITAAGAIFQSLDVIDFWFQSRVESRFVVIMRSVAFLLVSAVRVYLILDNAPLVAFAWAASLELLIAAGGLAVAYRSNGNRLLAWRVNVGRVRQ
jgi:O-antigen/teichoic acid export membrane protein